MSRCLLCDDEVDYDDTVDHFTDAHGIPIWEIFIVAGDGSRKFQWRYSGAGNVLG